VTGRPEHSLDPTYFERIYADSADPWHFATSDYELRKYRRSLGVLPRRHYVSAFEIGCSIGVFTFMLAPLCGRLLAVDVVPAAIAQAQARCARFSQVRFRRIRVPHELPAGRFDLIVASEVGYYLDRADLDRLAQFVCERLLPGGHLLLVHWTPEATDYPLTGDEVHRHVRVAVDPDLQLLAQSRRPTWRLDLFERRAAG
jgi:SAM-dependent methyltransferase